jgi:hypothetical protein
MRARLILVFAAFAWSFAGCSSSSKSAADAAADVIDTMSDSVGDGALDARDSADTTPPTWACETLVSTTAQIQAEVSSVSLCFSGQIGYHTNYPPDVVVDIGINEGIVVSNAAAQALVSSLQTAVANKLQTQCVDAGINLTGAQTGTLARAQYISQLIDSSHAMDLICNGVTFDANGIPVFEEDGGIGDASAQAFGFFNGVNEPCLANLTIVDPAGTCTN